MDTITLHLTSNQLCSRVTLHVDGEDYTATMHGDGHQASARAFAVRIRDALKHGKAVALDIIGW